MEIDKKPFDEAIVSTEEGEAKMSQN